MKKYLTKSMINSFLLSLHLCEEKTDELTIKKLYAISNNIENNYQVFSIEKKNKKMRKIYAPNYNLKNIQKNILHNILEQMPISPYAKAYIPGAHLKENALPHCSKRIILKLDIKDFFSSITFGEVLRNCFSYDYFPNSIAVLLTKLCTYYDYLPQGAPTSAYISNLVLKEFDEEVGKYCDSKNISYTRYSDDLTFSGDFCIREIKNYVKKEILKRGYLLNNEKTKVITCKNRQQVTGLVVNKKIQTNKTYRHKIRQEMYYIKKYSLKSHLERLGIEDEKKYLLSLKGRINYCLQINKLDQEMNKYIKDLESLLRKI